jgi:hypothetical protein
LHDDLADLSRISEKEFANCLTTLDPIAAWPFVPTALSSGTRWAYGILVATNRRCAALAGFTVLPLRPALSLWTAAL